MATNAQIKFLDLPNGKKLAYEKVDGSSNLPTVMFVPGFMSGKDGDKPKHLREYCMKKNYTFIRFLCKMLRKMYKLSCFSDMIPPVLEILLATGHLWSFRIGSRMLEVYWSTWGPPRTL